MQGLDRQEFLAFLCRRAAPARYPQIAPERIPEMLRLAVEADLSYMRQSGALDEEGGEGAAEYDEDDAFEEIVRAIETHYRLSEEDALSAAELVNDYMGWQEDYLAARGLLRWE